MSKVHLADPDHVLGAGYQNEPREKIEAAVALVADALDAATRGEGERRASDLHARAREAGRRSGDGIGERLVGAAERFREGLADAGEKANKATEAAIEGDPLNFAREAGEAAFRMAGIGGEGVEPVDPREAGRRAGREMGEEREEKR